MPFTLATEGEKRPQVWLMEFGDSAVRFVLAVWLTEEAARRNAAIVAAYLWELDTALKAHGIEIPYPQRDLHLRTAFGLSGEQAVALLRGGPDLPADASRPSSVEPAQVSSHERAALARNDETEDTRRQIASDAAERAAADANAAPPSNDDAPRSS